MTPKQYWDKAAKDPDVLNKYICDPVFDTKDFLDLIESNFNFKDKNVVEIGCGIGRLLGPLADKHKSTNFYGIDISDEMIELAPKKKNIKYNISPEQVDYIYSMLTFQHMPYDVKMNHMDTIADMLKPNGRLLFQFVVGDYHDDLVNHETSVVSMVEACEQRGLTIVRVDRGLLHEKWCFIEAVK